MSASNVGVAMLACVCKNISFQMFNLLAFGLHVEQGLTIVAMSVTFVCDPGFALSPTHELEFLLVLFTASRA